MFWFGYDGPNVGSSVGNGKFEMWLLLTKEDVIVGMMVFDEWMGEWDGGGDDDDDDGFIKIKVKIIVIPPSSILMATNLFQN